MNIYYVTVISHILIEKGCKSISLYLKGRVSTKVILT